MFAVLSAIDEAPSYFAEFATGDIWSIKEGKPRKLSGGLSKGYRIYALSINGCQVTRSGHRLVASAAYGPCPEGCECRHKNGNRSDNRADNLAWGTSSQNNGADKLAAGRLLYGDRHQNSKLTYADVTAIRSLRSSERPTLAALADRFGVTATTISRIVRYEAWQK